MKLIILTFMTSLLIAEIHNFREVNHNGKVLKNVKLVLNNSQFGFDIWHKEKLLKRGAYMIVSCKAKERFCLVENDSNCNWLKER